MSNSTAPAVIWHPTELFSVLESDPGLGKDSPEEWVGEDEHGRPCLMHRWTGDIVACARPLEDGQPVEFTWAQCFGSALIALERGGSWTVDHPPPLGTEVMFSGPRCRGATITELIQAVLREHDAERETEPTFQGQDREPFETQHGEWTELEARPPDRIPVTYVQALGTATLVFRTHPPRFAAP